MNYTISILTFLSLNVFGTPNLTAKTEKLKSDTGSVATINVFPTRPLIERDNAAQYLNFDFTVKNSSRHKLQLSAMEVSILDEHGTLVLRKSLNNNGQAASIRLVRKEVIKPGEVFNVFNPFYTFPLGIPLSHLRYTFTFNIADNKNETSKNEIRSPIDFDYTTAIQISPKLYNDKTTLYLPLKGRVIVWDGHDYYSHHRRFPVGLPKQVAMGVTANSNRYAYDFMSVDKNGHMYKGSPFKTRDWYSFGEPEFAPGSGRIVAAQNNIPDNEFVGKSVTQPDISRTMDPSGMGNYVIIDHGNGEYSVLLHMEKGSVRFKAGDKIRAGQQVGNVGFSGDAIYPHVHYTLIHGSTELVSEGLPSYFHHYKLYRGEKTINMNKGRIDSGDIIESGQ